MTTLESINNDISKTDSNIEFSREIRTDGTKLKEYFYQTLESYFNKEINSERFLDDFSVPFRYKDSDFTGLSDLEFDCISAIEEVISRMVHDDDTFDGSFFIDSETIKWIQDMYHMMMHDRTYLEAKEKIEIALQEVAQINQIIDSQYRGRAFKVYLNIYQGLEEQMRAFVELLEKGDTLLYEYEFQNAKIAKDE